MQRTLQISIIISLVILGLAFPTYAQDDTQPEQVATLEAMVSSLEAEVDQAEAAVATSIAISDEAQEILDEAGRRANDASNILGIFEGISVLIGLSGILFAGLSIFGLNRLYSAENELTETRDAVIEDIEEARKKFDSEFNNQRAKFEELETEIKEADKKRGETTENAILAQVYLTLGEKLYKAQNKLGALGSYEIALKLAPDNLVIRHRMGYIHTQLDNFEEARKYYEHVLAKRENFAPALAGLGLVIRREATKTDNAIEKDNKMDEAKRLIKKALDITPNLLDEDNESWWGVLGGLYRRQGRTELAIEAYKKATEITPHSSYGFGNLALLYGKNGDYDKMIKTYERTEETAEIEAVGHVNNFWAYADLVVSRYALGKPEKAAENLKWALRIAPDKSPYMLQGLRETLQELTTILVEKEKIPAIEDAIERIEAVEAERSAIIATRVDENTEESTS